MSFYKEMKVEKTGVLKSTFSISFFTIISRISGYFRDMLQAYYLGAGFYSDAFTIAYRIPNLLRRVLGEGGIPAGFIPVFTEVKQKQKEKTWRLAETLFWDLVIIAGVITILGIIFSPFIVKIIAGGFKAIPGKIELTIQLNRIIFPFIFFISLTSLAMAVLNSFGKFSLPAATPIFYNMTIIALVLIFSRFTENHALIFASGVTLGGLTQFLSQVPSLLKIGMRFKPNVSFEDEDIKKIGKLMIPVIIGAGGTQIQILIGAYIASSLLPQGSVSYLYYSDRVMELTLGVFSVALATVLLTLLSKYVSLADMEKMKEMLRFSIKITFFVTIPASIGLIVLSVPIINVLFQRGLFDESSTMKTAFALCFYAIGLPFFSLVKIFLQAFFSLQDTKTPVKVGVVCILIDIGFSFLLINFFSHAGIALALTIAGIANLFLLWISLERKIGKILTSELVKDIMKIMLISTLMGLINYFLKESFFSLSHKFIARSLVLLFLIGAGIITYALFSLSFFRKPLVNAIKVIKERK